MTTTYQQCEEAQANHAFGSGLLLALSLWGMVAIVTTLLNPRFSDPLLEQDLTVLMAMAE